MGILGFLYVVFMVVFAFCLLATLFGVAFAISSAWDPDPLPADEVMSNTMFVGSGVLGMVLSGIGWSICIIAERLANKGII